MVVRKSDSGRQIDSATIFESGARHSKISRSCKLQSQLSIGRPKDKKNDDSVSLQRALEPYYIHKVDGKD